MKRRRKFWDRATAIEALRWEADRIGRTPRDHDLRSPRRTCACLCTYRRLFGSLQGAQIAAGLTPNVPGRNTGWRKPLCKRGHPRTPKNLDTQGHCRLCAAHWASRRGRGPMRPKTWTVELERAATERKAAEITAAKMAYWSTPTGTSGRERAA